MNFKVTTLEAINKHFNLNLEFDTDEDIELYDDRWIVIEGDNWYKLSSKGFNEFYESI